MKLKQCMKSIHITLGISLIHTSIHQKLTQPHNTATSCKSITTASPFPTFSSIYEAISQKTYELFKNQIITLGPRDRSAQNPFIILSPTRFHYPWAPYKKPQELLFYIGCKEVLLGFGAFLRIYGCRGCGRLGLAIATTLLV
jgi:hypothetical protein